MCVENVFSGYLCLSVDDCKLELLAKQCVAAAADPAAAAALGKLFWGRVCINASKRDEGSTVLRCGS